LPPFWLALFNPGYVFSDFLITGFLIFRVQPDFGIILALLFVNCIVQFAEEAQAGSAIEALRKQLALRARVLRNGTWGELDSRELVPGDVIRVKVGDVVPSDGRLMSGEGLVVDQAALTGESLPVDRDLGQTILCTIALPPGCWI
jgi:H+-transporting ATPase